MQFIDKSDIMKGIGPDSTADILEKAMSHKYFKREGTPGNYKYYYTEDEYRKAKGTSKESDSKLEHNIVDDVNNGEIINSLFKEWDSIRTTEQHEKWAKKVANTKFGTYKEKTILNVIDSFNPKFRNEIVKNDFLNEVKRAYDSYEEKTVESTKEDESLKEKRKESDLDTFLVKMKKRVIDNHDNSPWEFPGSIKSATEKFANQFNLPVSDIGKLTEEGVLVISQEDKGTYRGGMFTSVKFDVNKLKSKTGYKKEESTLEGGIDTLLKPVVKLWIDATKTDNRREKENLIESANKLGLDIIKKNVDFSNPEKAWTILNSIKNRNPLVQSLVSRIKDHLRHSINIKNF